MFTLSSKHTCPCINSYSYNHSHNLNAHSHTHKTVETINGQNAIAIKKRVALN